MTKALLSRLASFALGTLSFGLFLGKADDHTLQALDSSAYARLALDATRNFPLKLPIADLASGQGHWVNGFNDHPFLLIWINGFFMRTLGPSAWSARFLPALLAVVGLFVLVAYGKRVFKSSAAGLVSALLLLTTPLYFSHAARFQLDPTHMMGIALSFMGWTLASLPLCTLGVIVAVWSKGILGFLVFPSVLLVKLVLRENRTAEWKRFVVFSAVGVFAGSLIWVFTAWLGDPALVGDYFRRFVFGQVAEVGRTANLAVLSGLFKRHFLWIPVIVLALAHAKRKGLLKDEKYLVLVAGSLIITLIVLLMHRKYPHYFMTVFVLMAVFAGAVFREWSERHETKIRSTLVVLALLVPAVLLAFPIPLGREKFPQLKAWIPFIARHGDCKDRIVFVEGGNPYGSNADASAVLQFYTNRHVVGAADCGRLADTLRDPAVAWVILSDEQYTACWDSKWDERFVDRIRYGNQQLLSKYAVLNGTHDLSPLQNTLQAVADCEVPKSRPSIYFRESTRSP